MKSVQARFDFGNLLQLEFLFTSNDTANSKLFVSFFQSGAGLSGLPNANAKSQHFSNAISQIAPLPRW